MNTLYYIEVNMTCILVLAILLWQHYRRVDNRSANIISYDLLIGFGILACASDMVAGIVRGLPGEAARVAIEVSNLTYFEAIILVSYQWSRYVSLAFGIAEKTSRTARLLWAAPLIVFTLIALMNPFTNYLFSINADNLYARGPGVLLHWFIAWFYLLAAFVVTVVVIRREKSKARRFELRPYLYFVIAPAIGSVLQMSFYGVTSIQVGTTLSILLLFLFNQNHEVLTDPLTGLNNRRHTERYCTRELQSHSSMDFFVVMIDLNSFKQINDTYGHVVGDRALCDAADVLRRACGRMESRVALCRYGGDEFLIVGARSTGDEVARLTQAVQTELAQKNEASDAPYQLSFALGSSAGTCASIKDVEGLVLNADHDMYEHKRGGRAIK